MLSSSELSRITSMLDSGDSDRFFKTADELEKSLEGEMDLISARRNVVVPEIPIDRDIVRLDNKRPALPVAAAMEQEALHE